VGGQDKKGSLEIWPLKRLSNCFLARHLNESTDLRPAPRKLCIKEDGWCAKGGFYSSRRGRSLFKDKKIKNGSSDFGGFLA